MQDLVCGGGVWEYGVFGHTLERQSFIINTLLIVADNYRIDQEGKPGARARGEGARLCFGVASCAARHRVSAGPQAASLPCLPFTHPPHTHKPGPGKYVILATGCAACRAVRDEYRRCPCGLAAYCDAACQRAHWPQHRALCDARKKGAETKAEAAAAPAEAAA
jgi:hypothetical protein